MRQLAILLVLILGSLSVYAWELPAAYMAMMTDGMTSPSSASSTLGQGLVAHYLLNDNTTNSTVLDTTGLHNANFTRNGSNIETTNATSSGKINNAFVFDRSLKDAVWNTAYNTNFPNSLTVAMWVYPTSDTYSGYPNDAYTYMFVPANYGIGLQRFSGTKLNVWPWDVVSSSSIPINAWTHIAVTGTNGTPWRVYINGTLDIVGSVNTDFSLFATAEVYRFGAQAGVRYNTGKIDDIRMYNRVLTSVEIQQIYNSGDGTESE